jgi:hypothetical protein
MSLSFSGAFSVAPTVQRADVRMETVADLKALAKELNPVIGYWNPLKIGENFNENELSAYTDEELISWFRHAEIKHGRVAMAAFVGFTVQSLGIHFPWNIAGDLSCGALSAVGGPGAQWDALPTAGKAQIITFVALLELLSESSYALEKSGQKHYMKGGKPGFFPSIKAEGVVPHPVPLDFFDPFGFQKKLTDEQKSKKLLAEINNGRLAMIGIFGCISSSKGLIVPGLDSMGIAPYSGEYMAPFEGAW